MQEEQLLNPKYSYSGGKKKKKLLISFKKMEMLQRNRETYQLDLKLMCSFFSGHFGFTFLLLIQTTIVKSSFSFCLEMYSLIAEPTSKSNSPLITQL